MLKTEAMDNIQVLFTKTHCTAKVKLKTIQINHFKLSAFWEGKKIETAEICVP